MAYLLQRLNFLPLNYVENRADAAKASFAGFLSAQVADVAVVVAFAVFALLWPRTGASAVASQTSEAPGVDPRRAAAFLSILGIGPLLATVVVAAGVGAKPMWTAPMFNLAGLLLLFPFRDKVDPVTLRRIAGAAFAACLLSSIAYFGTEVADPFVAERPLRTAWPQAEIAKRMLALWSELTHAPLRIVGGDSWVAGLVALDAPDRPSIYDTEEPRLSPWITPERLAAEGVLLVWSSDRKSERAGWSALPPGTIQGEQTFVWSPSSTKPPLRIEYAIIPPAA